MRGAPKLLSITTLRPLGPSVTLTASARMSTPRRMRSRASRENLLIFSAIISTSAFLSDNALKRSEYVAQPVEPLSSANNPEDVAFLHDQQVFTVDLHCGAGPFAEKDAITSLDVERCDLAIFALGACASSDDFAFRGLFLGAVRDDDPASSLLFRLYTANENAIMQRTKTHMLTFLSIFPAGGTAGLDRKSTSLDSSPQCVSHMPTTTINKTTHQTKHIH